MVIDSSPRIAVYAGHPSKHSVQRSICVYLQNHYSTQNNEPNKPSQQVVMADRQPYAKTQLVEGKYENKKNTYQRLLSK